MTALDYVIGALVLLVSIIVVGVVLLQQGHRSGINGAISGAADTFLSKTKSNHDCGYYNVKIKVRMYNDLLNINCLLWSI